MPTSAQEFFGGSPIMPAKRKTPWSGVGDTSQTPLKLPEGNLLPTDPDIRAGLEEAATRHKINPALLMALAQQESNYNPGAIGVPTKWGRASGMFQYLDSTAKGHGIDPLDWKQAADAAASDMAAQIAKHGVDWAVATHHGGPNPKQHGPKTAKYVREVLAKTQLIAKELGINFELPEEQKPDFSNVTHGDIPKAADFFGTAPVAKTTRTSGTSTEPPDAGGQESLLDTVRGVALDAPHRGPFELDAKPGERMGLGDVAKGVGNVLLGPVTRTIERGWEGIQNAINRETTEVTRTDDELKRMWEENPSMAGAAARRGETFQTWADRNRTVNVTKETSDEEAAKWQKRIAANPDDAYLLPKRLDFLRPKADDSHFAPKDTFTGVMQRVISNHKNPMDLFLQDSIPADVVTALFTLPELERKKFDKARNITKALEVTNDPEGKSPEELKQANEVIEEWKKRTDASIVDSWNELYQAAKEDPATIATGFSEALISDPELLLAPVGVGAKPIRALQAAKVAATGVRTTTIAARAAKIADRILDAAGTTAAVNVAAGISENLATEGEVNTSEVKMNAAMGVILGGTLSGIFHKGARAKATDLNKAKLEGTYEETLRAQAAADVEVETQARKAYDDQHGVGEHQTDVQKKIAELLGIRTAKDKASWLAKRRKEVKDTFKNQSDYADYQKFVAEERVRRAAELAEAAEVRQREAAEAAQGSSEDAAAKRQRLSDEFDAAVIARNEAEKSGELDSAHQAAKAEDQARTAADHLNAEEMYYAALSQDHPTVKRAENNIARRESQLRRPKWQRGEVDPDTLARIAVAGTGAAAGYALFPKDQKLQGSLLGGLAGLLAPAGGSVLGRMRQAGAIAGDGQIIGALVKAGKMANKLDEAAIKARDNTLMVATRAGDQNGFRQLYDAYFPTIKRFARKYMQGNETKTGLDAEDIAQQAFVKAYDKLVNDPTFEIDNFPGFVTRIAENEALQSLRKSSSQREGANVINESTSRRFDDEGNELSGRSVMDSTEGSPDYNVGLEDLKDTPELMAVRDESLDIIRQAFDQLPETTQKVMTLAHVENFVAREIADQLKLPLNTVLSHLARGEKMVRRSIEENRRTLGEPVTGPRGQRGSVNPEDLATVGKVGATALAGGAATYFLFGEKDQPTEWFDWYKMGIGSVLAAAVLSKSGRAGLSKVASKGLRGIDYALNDISPLLFRKVKEAGLNEHKRLTQYRDSAIPFNAILRKLPKDIQGLIARALSTGDKNVINKMLHETGGSAFVKAFDQISNTTLKELREKLIKFGRIKEQDFTYFPQRVKDVEGLRRALGKEASDAVDAQVKSIDEHAVKTTGEPLSDLERSELINKLFSDYIKHGDFMPGFAKARRIKDIPEKLQPFYHSPSEALDLYLREANKDIVKAEFFGDDLVYRKEGGQKYTNTNASIKQLTDRLMQEGKLTVDQATQMSMILKDRFGPGEQSPWKFVQGVRNLGNGMLLGNLWAAASQIGDTIIQAYLQGPKASAKAAAKMITRKNVIKMKDLGLSTHIAEEFSSEGFTHKVMAGSLKWGGFRAPDYVGKSFGLNAAVEKMFDLAQTEKGQMAIANKYKSFMGDDFPKLLSELKSRKPTDLAELVAWTELTRSQPLTSWELPTFYHKHPNGRIIYSMQTFSIRVMNLVYEDALKDIFSGSAKRFALGTKSLIGLGAVLGVQGVFSDKIKDAMSGKPIELHPMDIPLNALQALGLSTYTYDRIQRRGVVEGVVVDKIPAPFRIMGDIAMEPERSVRLIPIVGRPLYEINKEELEKARAERRKKEGYYLNLKVESEAYRKRKNKRSSSRRD